MLKDKIHNENAVVIIFARNYATTLWRRKIEAVNEK